MKRTKICLIDVSIPKMVKNLNLLKESFVDTIMLPSSLLSSNAEEAANAVKLACNAGLRAIVELSFVNRNSAGPLCTSYRRFFDRLGGVNPSLLTFRIKGVCCLTRKHARNFVRSIRSKFPQAEVSGYFSLNGTMPDMAEKLTFFEKVFFWMRGKTANSVELWYHKILDVNEMNENYLTDDLTSFSSLLHDDERTDLNAGEEDNKKKILQDTTDYSFSDMVLSTDELEQAKEILALIKDVPAILKDETNNSSLQLELRKSFLFILHGAPGTGKTLLAQLLATQLGREYIEVSLADVLGRLVGDSEKHLSKLFAHAEKHNQILIFNEGDAIFCSRSNSDMAASDNKLVSHALSLLESSKVDCFITTNRLPAIDFAVKSRALYTLHVESPSDELLGRLFEKNIRFKGIKVSGIDCRSLGKAAQGLSFRDINKTILCALARMSVRGDRILTQDDLEYCILRRKESDKIGPEGCEVVDDVKVNLPGTDYVGHDQVVGTYNPAPLDTTGVEIGEELSELVESMASNTHDTWAQQRIRDGWTYGPRRDDELKQHPDLVPYKDLSEGEKLYDRSTSLEAIRFILGKGFSIKRI